MKIKVSYEQRKTLLPILFEYVIENVGDYDALICREGIKVGCQTISFEKFDEIAEAVRKCRS